MSESATNPHSVYIVGASGRSGIVLCRSLLADGIPVVAVVRNQEKWRGHGIPCPALVADLADGAAMGAALATARLVVSCAHARHIPEILAAAPIAERFVFLGSTRKFTRWLDDHGKGVLAGEAFFLQSGHNGAILHPTMIYGAEGENNVRRLAALLRRLPLVPLPDGGAALVQPIHQQDVTRSIRAALKIDWTGAHSLIIAGPKPTSYADFVHAVAAAAGLKPPRLITVPTGILIAAARLCRMLPGLPKLGADELRRLVENKNFDIGDMIGLLNVKPISLFEGLAMTFGRKSD